VAFAVALVVGVPVAAAGGIWAIRQASQPGSGGTGSAAAAAGSPSPGGAQPAPGVSPPAASAPGISAPAASAPAAGSAPSSPLGSAPPDATGVTAHSAVTPSTGTQVFDDDFSDPSSGWRIGQFDGGVTYSYVPGGYSVIAPGPYLFYAPLPFPGDLGQVSVSMTAASQASSAGTAGFGVSCIRDMGGASQLEYDLAITQSGRWYVQRFNGSFDDNSDPVLLRAGAAAARPAKGPVSLVGVCAAMDGGRRVRLMLFIDGTPVVDFVDDAVADPTGWQAALLVAGDDGGSTRVTVSHVSEADLGGPQALGGVQT
jgi:hypothetical protein